MSATTDIGLLALAGVGLYLLASKFTGSDPITEAVEEGKQDVVTVIREVTNTQAERGMSPSERNTYNIYNAGTFTGSDAAQHGSVAQKMYRSKRDAGHVVNAIRNGKTENIGAILRVSEADPFRDMSTSAFKYVSSKGKTYQLSDA